MRDIKHVILIILVLLSVCISASCSNRPNASSDISETADSAIRETEKTPVPYTPEPTAEPTPVPTAQPVPEPTPYPEGTRIIYMTFDDGPSDFTDELLDILAEYGVKATFFVTGDSPDNYGCIGRAYSEGHSIGIHCMHHQDYKMYSSFDDYWADFDEIDSLIFDQTGMHTKIMRFPGGSSNKRASGAHDMMGRLAVMVGERGYVYFDWNATSGDAKDDPPSVEDTFIKMRRSAEKSGEYCVLLNHDTKPNTVEAVKTFIPWALEHGFVFKPLDADSPTAHHNIYAQRMKKIIKK